MWMHDSAKKVDKNREAVCVCCGEYENTRKQRRRNSQKVIGKMARRSVAASAILRLLLLQLRLDAGDAYTHITTSYPSLDQDRIRFSWSMPELSSEDAGLGNGIQYAVDGGLCERLLPRFREQSQHPLARILSLGVTFVDCIEIYDAIGRGFGTWASNHKQIAFKDVSGVCSRLSGSANASACDVAEVTIDALAPEDDSEAKLAAFVRNYRAKAVLFSTSTGRRTTGGRYEPADFAIGYSEMVFNTAQCWYLDNTFCAPLHAMSEVVDIVFRVGLLLMWLGGWAMLVLWLQDASSRALRELRATSDEVLDDPHFEGVGLREAPTAALVAADKRRRACCGRYGRRLSALATGFTDAIEGLSALSATACLLLLISPPVGYLQIYAPCIECYDFEAAAAHEIGHVLGFHHPNDDTKRNFRATTGPMGAAICASPLTDLETNTSASPAPSIMFATTTHNARACLSADDLDGLNYLYPSCDVVRASARPFCVKAKRRSGYLRLLLAIGVPVALGVALEQLLACYAARRERKRFTQLARDLHAIRRVGKRGGHYDHLMGSFDAALLGGASRRKKARAVGRVDRAEEDAPRRGLLRYFLCCGCFRRRRRREGANEGGDGDEEGAEAVAEDDDEELDETKSERRARRRQRAEARKGAVRAFRQRAREAGEAAVVTEKRDRAKDRWMRGGAHAIAAAQQRGPAAAPAAAPGGWWRKRRGGASAAASPAKHEVAMSGELSELLHLFEPSTIVAWVRSGELGALRAHLGRLARSIRHMHEDLTSSSAAAAVASAAFAPHTSTQGGPGGGVAPATRRRRRLPPGVPFGRSRGGAAAAGDGTFGPLPGGKVGQRNDLYRRLSHQMPLCVDAFVEGDEGEMRDLGAVLRAVEDAELEGLEAERRARDPPPPPPPTAKAKSKATATLKEEAAAGLDPSTPRLLPGELSVSATVLETVDGAPDGAVPAARAEASLPDGAERRGHGGSVEEESCDAAGSGSGADGENVGGTSIATTAPATDEANSSPDGGVERRAPARAPAATESGGDVDEQQMPPPPAAAADVEELTEEQLLWQQWLAGSAKSPPAIKAKPMPKMEWDEDSDDESQADPASSSQQPPAPAQPKRSGSGLYDAADEAAAWRAWQDNEARVLPQPKILKQLANRAARRGGSAGAGSSSHDARGLRGLRYAPLLLHDERASFLRWFAEAMAEAEAAEGLRAAAVAEGEGAEEEAAEAAAAAEEALATVGAVVELLGDVEVASRNQKVRLAAAAAGSAGGARVGGLGGGARGFSFGLRTRRHAAVGGMHHGGNVQQHQQAKTTNDGGAA